MSDEQQDADHRPADVGGHLFHGRRADHPIRVVRREAAPNPRAEPACAVCCVAPPSLAPSRHPDEQVHSTQAHECTQSIKACAPTTARPDGRTDGKQRCCSTVDHVAQYDADNRSTAAGSTRSAERRGGAFYIRSPRMHSWVRASMHGNREGYTSLKWRSIGILRK